MSEACPGRTSLIAVGPSFSNSGITRCCFLFFGSLNLILRSCGCIGTCRRTCRTLGRKMRDRVWSCTSCWVIFFPLFHNRCGRRRTALMRTITNLLNGQNPFSYQNLHFFHINEGTSVLNFCLKSRVFLVYFWVGSSWLLMHWGFILIQSIIQNWNQKEIWIILWELWERKERSLNGSGRGFCGKHRGEFEEVN